MQTIEQEMTISYCVNIQIYNHIYTNNHDTMKAVGNSNNKRGPERLREGGVPIVK